MTSLWAEVNQQRDRREEFKERIGEKCFRRTKAIVYRSVKSTILISLTYTSVPLFLVTIKDWRLLDLKAVVIDELLSPNVLMFSLATSLTFFGLLPLLLTVSNLRILRHSRVPVLNAFIGTVTVFCWCLIWISVIALLVGNFVVLPLTLILVLPIVFISWSLLNLMFNDVRFSKVSRLENGLSVILAMSIFIAGLVLFFYLYNKI